ncbi:hypothetical protein B7463_g4071, partial [Scytalidium lignicola]
MGLRATMAFVINFILVALLCLIIPRATATSSSSGKIELFSDESCTDQVSSKSSPIPLDVCILGSATGERSYSFIVPDKPYCEDGNRPDLVLFQDPCCTDGVANYIPNALYGDYGNGSCQPLLGGDFVAYVFSCGDFPIPTPSILSIHFTFPAPSSTTSMFQGCPATSSYAQSTSLSNGESAPQKTVNDSPSSTTMPTSSITPINGKATAVRTSLPSSTSTKSSAKSLFIQRGIVSRVLCGGVLSLLVALLA